MKGALTTGEVAHYCRVNFRTVSRWIEMGKLRAYQLPGRGDNRVAWSDFISFLSTQDIPFKKCSDSDQQRIFLVDDDHLMCRAGQRSLNYAGYNVALSTDGFSAPPLIKAFAPSLLITDLRMPGLGGIQLIESLRQDAISGDALRILAITGGSSQLLREAYHSGANATLAKPFDSDRLLKIVRTLMASPLSPAPTDNSPPQ